MALLLDGEVQALDEQAEQIVFDRWDAAALDGKFAATLAEIKKVSKK